MQRWIRLLIILPFIVVGTVVALILIVHGPEAVSDVPKSHSIAFVVGLAFGLYVLVALPVVLVVIVLQFIRDRRRAKHPPKLPNVL